MFASFLIHSGGKDKAIYFLKKTHFRLRSFIIGLQIYKFQSIIKIYIHLILY